jgi:hypothetical protein
VARLKPVIACIRGEELLTATIPEAWKGSPSTAKAVLLTAIAHTPLRKQAKLLRPLAKSHTFVEAELVGDGVIYHLVLAVSPSAKVSALLADSVVGEGPGRPGRVRRGVLPATRARRRAEV